MIDVMNKEPLFCFAMPSAMKSLGLHILKIALQFANCNTLSQSLFFFVFFCKIKYVKYGNWKNPTGNVVISLILMFG